MKPEDKPDILSIARQTIRIEAETLTALADSLDDTGDFQACVEAIAASQGRLVLTGIGKSAIVAQKIVATLNSTGTPALFLHAADAIHGDIGMIRPYDLVLCISKSGETAEVRVLIPLVKNFGNPIIAMTANRQSTLARQSDYLLWTPVEQEADPNNLAPTSSTAAQMALGDALAVALLERKGFSADDFRQLHPGGKLGQKLLRVADLMHVGKELPLIGEDAGMQDAILTITAKTYGCVGVVNPAGDLVGIITDGDLRRHMGDDLLHRRVAEVMTAKPRTIRANALAAEALHVMNEKSITSLFVIDDRKPVGIVRLHDCLKVGVA